MRWNEIFTLLQTNLVAFIPNEGLTVVWGWTKWGARHSRITWNCLAVVFHLLWCLSDLETVFCFCERVETDLERGKFCKLVDERFEQLGTLCINELENWNIMGFCRWKNESKTNLLMFQKLRGVELTEKVLGFKNQRNIERKWVDKWLLYDDLGEENGWSWVAHKFYSFFSEKDTVGKKLLWKELHIRESTRNWVSSEWHIVCIN